MRKADRKDIPLAVRIISESFDQNPGVVYTVKQDKKLELRYRRLTKYVVKRAIRKSALYFSSDNKGVLIFYKYKDHPDSLADLWGKLYLICFVVGITRVGKLLSRENHLAKQRPIDGNYLYTWFFGVEKVARGKGAAVELKNYLYQKAEELKLPIYIETTIPVNKKIYERYGFEIYHTWKLPGTDITYWMMRREAPSE
jgi:GNAT superfamily N-acetyltransferase